MEHRQSIDCIHLIAENNQLGWGNNVGSRQGKLQLPIIFWIESIQWNTGFRHFFLQEHDTKY